MAEWFEILVRHPLLGALTACGGILVAVCLYRFFYITLFWTFTIGGLSLGYFWINPESILPNILIFHTRKKKEKRIEDELSLLKKKCPVCGDHTCKRHRPELNIVALKPWNNLNIPQRVDIAITEFLDLTLKEFVFTWYRDLSSDDAFVDELKTSLRFLASVILRRLNTVDIPSLITQKIITAALRHIHHCVKARRNTPDTKAFEQAALDSYGKHLHIALRNRRAEVDYLRGAVEKVSPYILPLQSLKCRSLCILIREILAGAIMLPAVDALADPDMVNKLLLVFLDDSPPPECHDPPSPYVTILADFGQAQARSNSCLHMELSDILNSSTALYPFMQFMKSEASVSVLQFYLSAEEFNGKLLRPDMSEQEIIDLHKELQDLYRMYCDPEAPDHIQFQEDIISELKNICEGPPESVIRLQTTTALFRAYEHTYELLETTFLPLFHQSDDYYSMLCGTRLPSSLPRSQSWSNKRPYDAMSGSRFGNKLKQAFKNNSVEGDHPDGSLLTMEGIEPVLKEDLEDELLDGPDPFSSGPKHNLTTWRVSIPTIASRPEPDNHKKFNYVFVIDVRRVDCCDGKDHWRVDRRYHEFYILEQKLLEFHGEQIELRLPPKKAFGTKSFDFLETKMESFERYLQVLLTKPFLTGSELLHRFLTSDQEFTTSFLPDLSLGRIVKSGAMKLMRERGQHLDPFLQSFLVSVESAKSRPNKPDRDSDTVSISSEKMANPLYENNAGVTVDNIVITEAAMQPVDDIHGAYDTLVYLAKHVFNSPEWLHDLLLLMRILIKSSMENYLDWYLNMKLQKVFREHRLVQYIHLLRDVIFFDTDPPRTDEQKKQRRQEALDGLLDFIPKPFTSAVGKDKHEAGTELIFNFFQQPRLNKQFTYTLLDIVLEELFPELLERSTDQMAWDPFR